MKNNNILCAVFSIFCLLAPLQSFAAEWSIGIYEGASPLELAPIPSTPSPVLTAQDVLDIPADFVADPFLLTLGDTWYLFFEALNNSTGQGDIGYATSDNGLDWTYQQIVLDEPYHLSYPYVFEWLGDYYMVPESYQVSSILLYRAVNFPTDWEFVATLVSGLPYVDPSPFYYNDVWWMFATTGDNDTLHLFYADALAGPWVEHLSSPVVEGNSNIARPGGRVLQFNGRLLRITQDDNPTYGNQVRAFEITTLSKVDYAEFEVPESPLISATGSGWNADGMHHIDALRLPSGSWLAAVDGFGDPTEYQGTGIAKDNWTLWFVDSEELIGEDGAASNAFDGNADTLWHTEWSQTSPPPPHEIQLFLSDAYDIDGFRYVPRQDGGINGRIADYEFFVSSDGVNWGLPVASGTFANDASIKEIRFAPVTGQYVRLRALSEVNGGDWTSMAELDVFGVSAGSTNLPPNGVIDTPALNVTINAGESVDFSGTGSDADGDLPLSYLWRFGAGSGIADSTLEDPGLIQFNNVGTFTVTLTVTDAQGLADPTPASRTITVLDNSVGVPIPQSNWTLWFVDSEELFGEDGAASNAFDGNTGTIWHTEWDLASPPPPHEIQLFLGDAYDIDGFRYVPRQDGGINGRIADYEFYVSADGVNWGLPVASGTFANTASTQEIRFPLVTGQFVRLRALSEVNGNDWTSVAELEVLGVPAAGGTNLPPNGVIDSPSQNLTINVGESVSFAGTGSDADGDLPLSYLWRFGAASGIADSTLEDPGLIQFNNVGTFSVTLTVTDAQGLADPTPASRTITVLEGPNLPPNGVINSPSQNLTVNVGESVSFAGTGSDADGDLPLSYLWRFGAGSGIVDSTLEDPGLIQFNNVGTFTVTLTVTDAQGLADPTPASRTITVLDNSVGVPIPQSNWTLWFVDSEELFGEDGAASNAFDGNTGTIWHTEWDLASPPPPHEIQLFLGDAYDIDGFRYVPRQDGSPNGRIGDYEFFVSSDGANWGTPVAFGTFANTASTQEIRFPPVTGQFVRLRALSEVNGNDWTSVAELEVLGVPAAGGTNLPPNGVINSPSQNLTINVGEPVSFAGTGSDVDGDLPLSYLWRFGTASGIANSTLEDPGLIQFNNVGTFTVTLTVTDALGLADPTPASRTITVLDNSVGVPIPQSNWTLWFVDSEELFGEDGAASNAFDGNTGTIWHTEWDLASPPPPHEIQLFLGDAYDIDGFRYVPRQDGGINGRIADYEFYVSADGADWGLPVASGTFANAASTQEIRFPPVTGQFVRLRALSEVNGNDWTSVAELEVLGIPAAGGTNLPPNGVIDSPSQNLTVNVGESVSFAGTGSDIDGDLPLSYLWRFGAASAVADSTLEDPGLIQFNNVGTFTVTLTVTDALGLADPTPASRTITVLDNSVGVPIPQSNWTLWFVDSEELFGEDGAASNAFDGNTGTIWHTEWDLASPPPPHEIQLFLGDAYDIDGFRYVPRQDGSPNGRIADYEFFVSSDGANWGLPVASGTFANTASTQEIRFPPVTGQFVRLRALSEVNGNDWTSVAELQVLGVPVAGGTNLPPVATGSCNTTPQEQTLPGTLNATDAETPALLMYSLGADGSDGLGPITTAKGGTVTITDATTGAFIYQPASSGARGTDSFDYQVSDPGGESDSATETVVVDEKIMPLGDSITAGETGSPLLAANMVGYRKPLYDLLTAAGLRFDFVGSRSEGSGVSSFDFNHEGHPAWTAFDIAFGLTGFPTDGVRAWLDANPADIVLLHAGTNELNSTNELDIADILDEIDQWEASPGGNPVTVLLALIIDQDPINPGVTTLNTDVQAMAQARILAGDTIIIVDQHSALIYPDDMGDQLHPKETGYGKMAGAWFTPLSPIIDACP